MSALICIRRTGTLLCAIFLFIFGGIMQQINMDNFFNNECNYVHAYISQLSILQFIVVGGMTAFCADTRLVASMENKKYFLIILYIEQLVSTVCTFIIYYNMNTTCREFLIVEHPNMWTIIWINYVLAWINIMCGCLIAFLLLLRIYRQYCHRRQNQPNDCEDPATDYISK
jgi:hypothetical protein